MIEVIRYRLPSYWACPLINDDYTGLTDEECEEIQRFLEAAEGYPVDVDWGTQGFYRCNDAGTLPEECADFIFHKCNDKIETIWKLQTNCFIQVQNSLQKMKKIIE